MTEKRRLVLRRKEIEITEGDYAGWKFTAIVNPPLRVIETLTSAKLTDMIDGLAGILVEPWNFVDEEGNVLGAPSAETIRELPLDLISAVSDAYISETTKLPQK